MSLELYNTALRELAREGKALVRLTSPRHSVTLDNPLCGDRVTIDIDMDDAQRLQALGGKVRGCLLCEASLAMMARHADGATLSDLRIAGEDLRRLLDSRPLSSGHWPELMHFAPVASFSSRYQCVSLPFDALEDLSQEL